jgi:hypothetical protein
LYGPNGRREWRSTAEFTITTAPADSTSAGVSSRVSRSAASTLTSKLDRRSSRSTLPRLRIGGIANALFTSASTRPNSSSAARTSAALASSSVRSVGTTSARRPAAVTFPATSVRYDSVRAASTTSAPIWAARTASAWPSPGPIPATSTTFSASSTAQPSIRVAVAACRTVMRSRQAAASIGS